MVSVHRQEDHATCVLGNRTNLLVSRFLAGYVAVGDEITFPIFSDDKSSLEIYITKSSVSSGLNRCLYQAPIGYVTQPKLDKRDQHFVSAELQQRALGISTILLPCRALRDYFYRQPGAAKDAQPNFYENLRITPSASPAELRVAYKLRTLELAAGTRSEQLALERAFNILGQPESRACYDALLADPEAPAMFPYGGFGSLLVSGERSVTGRHFSPIVSWCFHRNEGASDSTCRCASAISTRTGPSAATCAASSNFGSIPPSSMPFGTPLGISGNIWCRPRWT